LEHSDAWAKGDKGAERFFVYILKLEDGDFYVGQTRELRERLSEHRDQKASSTARRNPKLQYFEILPTREAAELREAELKKLRDSNPRQIRRMIISFHDLIREVQLE
jgi:predicted GIY-YIG superfamily endonuclease